jgi:hypothetical protein
MPTDGVISLAFNGTRRIVKAQRMALAVALIGSLALIGTGERPAVAAPAADCSPSQRAHADRPHDLNTVPEHGGARRADSVEKILSAAYDRQTLPRTMLTKGSDGKVHARLTAGAVRIPVNVHVVHDGETGKVRAVDVLRQIAEMNRNYARTPARMFTFWLKSVDYTDNKAWHYAMAMKADEKAMKSALHKGGANELNLYLNEPGYEKPGDLIGIATWPWDYQAASALDGVMLRYSTIPGGADKPFNEGKQASHETGHWLGLYHTFQDGCKPPGDQVDDTPAVAAPTNGCPTDLKACDGRSDAPVHNFMDYSDDRCLSEFTAGQARRAADHWLAYRHPRSGAHS